MKGLYLITPDWDDTDKLLAATEQGLLGGASLLQYRHKTAHDDLQQEQARALLALCRRYRVPFIINDHLALCAMLDAALLRRVLDNLVENARQHTPAGGTVTLSASVAGDVLRIGVADTGPGVAGQSLELM